MNFGKMGRKKQKQKLHSGPKKIIHLINSVVIKVLIFALVIGTVLGGAAAIAVYKAIIDGAPSIDNNTLEKVVPVGFASIVYDQNGNEIQKLSVANANRIYVEYDKIPKCMIDAVVAVEDERFWKHNGFDMYAFMRAVVANIKSRSFSEGGSTLTQQVVKMNILKDSSKKIERKLQEQYLAVQLEKKLAENGKGKEYAKKLILELYLNSAPFGKNSNGIQTAAQTYFNKNAWDLTVAEAACIAGVTNAPSRYDPISNPDKNRERQQRILRKMWEQGYITEPEYKAALAEDVYGNIRSINQQMASNASNHTYFVDEVILRLVEDLQIKGYTEAQAYRLVYSGGLSIFTTQDTEIQQKVDEVFAEETNFFPNGKHKEVKLMYSLSEKKGKEVTHHYKEGEFKNQEAAEQFIEEYKKDLGLTAKEIIAEKAVYVPQPQSAMVIMDYRTGQVKAMVGGRGRKDGNLTFNRATQAYRQPGSTFKPLASYTAALDVKNYTLATVINDAPVSIKIPGGKNYTPKNWTKSYKGLSTVREGIAQSMNILSVKTLVDVTPELGFEYLRKYGFNRLKPEVDAVYAMALGGIYTGVSTLEMTAAYGAIANKGVYIEPTLYTKVLDADGNVLLDKRPTSHAVMKETTSFLLTSAMQDVVRRGTGTTTAVKNMNTAGKTGTSQESNDLWFIGYSPYYVGGIWLGYDQQRSMNHIYQSTHNIVWSKVMTAIHEGLPNKNFEIPKGIVKKAVCTESGLLPAEGLCENDPRGNTITEEFFALGTEPQEACDVHKEVNICKVSGLFATDFCPPEHVQKKVMIQRRPQDVPDEDWDPSVPLPVEDAEFEIPYTMVGEYCTIHTGLEDNPQNGENTFNPDASFSAPTDN